ncbi:UvrD-helicase domain-containing protein [bacterium]|nr:UvrD-helicase domain-containing protein [bacterium]
MVEKLNKEQKEAVRYEGGPLLVIAGAGTGKTTVITERLAWILKSNRAQENEVVGLTFTEKAAEEMEERVGQILDSSYLDIWISTFHSFCERILRNYAFDIGISPDFKVLNQTSAWLLVRQNLNRFSLKYYRLLSSPARFIHILLEHFSRCKDEGIYPDDYLQYAASLRQNAKNGGRREKLTDELKKIKEIALIYSEYQRLILEKGYLDFGDLINYTLKLLRERKAILSQLREQFKYILVDEFQDTNWAQYELLKLLSPPKNNLTVCADDDQSIYLFRGASFNNVLQFRKDFPNAKEVVLVRNYRSTQNILDSAYKFIQQNNPNRLEYQINKDREIVEKAKKKGVDLSHFKRVKKHLRAANGEVGDIKHFHFRTLEEEAKGVAEEIIKLYKEDKEANLSDFAILVRTNALAQPFSQALLRANVPHQFLALKGLYSKPIILDIISYFKLLDNYHESSAAWRVLNFPFLKISQEDISTIVSISKMNSQSIYETLSHISSQEKISENTKRKIKKLLYLLKKHSQLSKEKSTSEIFISFLKESGYLDYLSKGECQGAKEKISLINQFYDKIKLFEENETDPRLNRFMQLLEWEIESGEEGSLKFDIENIEDAVKIMTIHAAKGLEFKYVFLVGLVDKHFPTIERKAPIEIPEQLLKEVTPKGDAHLQEERRLFYVGMTRAKRGLFFTSADDYGGQRKKKISRFLKELGFSASSKESEISFLQKKRKILLQIEKRQKEKPLQLSHLSYTQIVAFKNCPLQYKFAHLLKIPCRGKASFSFGKSMHRTLFEFVKLYSRTKQEKKKIPPLARLLKIYKENWIPKWYLSENQKREYFLLGEKSLRKFYKSLVKERPKIKFLDAQPLLEKDFNLKIGNYILLGRIDRIDELEKGDVEIIDYKSGNPKKKLSKEEKKQLLIYQMAAEEILNLNVAKLTYYYLYDNSKVSFLGSEKEKQGLKEEILEVARKIEKSDFSPTPGWQCQYCDFRDICEFRKSSN